jgi:hypothetical protein
MFCSIFKQLRDPAVCSMSAENIFAPALSCFSLRLEVATIAMAS